MSSGKRKEKEIKNNKALSDRFFQLMVLSIIIFMIGLFGYLLTLLEMYDLDSQPDFLFLLIIGLMSTLGSFFSKRHLDSENYRANDARQEILKNDIKDNLQNIENELSEISKSLDEKKEESDKKIKEYCDEKFCWDDVPGSPQEIEKLKEFLKWTYNIHSLQTAIIVKTGKDTIKVTIDDDEKLFLRIKNNEVILQKENKKDGNKELIPKLIAIKDNKDNDKLKIYIKKIDILE
ncbi:MAG: hypothetical protein O8C63_12745 [Candidatus Methanoperedens sp.]|nr:hypothetical protein [Candidatus Methanoperedens sp.]